MNAHAFENALELYRLAGEAAIQAEETYRRAFAAAILASKGGNAEARKADAETATSNERLARDRAALEREIARHMVEYLKVAAGKDVAA